MTYCLYTESSSTARGFYCDVNSVNLLAVVWVTPEGKYWGQHLVAGTRSCVLCVQDITERQRGTFPFAVYSPHYTVLKQIFTQRITFAHRCVICKTRTASHENDNLSYPSPSYSSHMHAVYETSLKMTMYYTRGVG